jgi:hypothetical protein
MVKYENLTSNSIVKYVQILVDYNSELLLYYYYYYYLSVLLLLLFIGIIIITIIIQSLTFCEI